MSNTPMKDFFFVINPAAGRRTHLAVIAEIEAYCTQHNLSYDLAVTKAPKQGTQIASDKAPGFRAVIAVGGDGTVNEVGSALVGTDTALGIIPIGTGNDFAHQLGYTQKLKGSLEILRVFSQKKIDIIEVNGDRYALNAFGVGFDATVAQNFQKYRPYVGGLPAYALSVFQSLPRFTFPKAQVILDTYHTIIDDILLVAVCNGTTYGGGFQVAPSAKMDDQVLTVCMVKKVSKWYALRKLPSFQRGKHLELPEVEMHTAKHVNLSLAPDTIAQIDGEILPKQSAYLLRLLPHALNVIHA